MININIFLEDEYISGVREAVASGKTARIVLGKRTYQDIQENLEVKEIYEKLLISPNVSIRFNPEIPENVEQIITEMYFWERDRKTGDGSAERSTRKATKKMIEADKCFEGGIILKDFNAPTEDLITRYKNKKSK